MKRPLNLWPGEWDWYPCKGLPETLIHPLYLVRMQHEGSIFKGEREPSASILSASALVLGFPTPRTMSNTLELPSLRYCAVAVPRTRRRQKHGGVGLQQHGLAINPSSAGACHHSAEFSLYPLVSTDSCTLQSSHYIL